MRHRLRSTTLDVPAATGPKMDERARTIAAAVAIASSFLP